MVAPAAIQITTNVTGIAQASPGYYDYALNPDLDVAIFTGLLGKTGRETSANLFTCPSGNCTFPAAPDTGASYQTLAIESSCTDITSSVLLDETYGWILPPRTEFLDPSLLDAIQNTTWIFPTSVKESEFENQVRKSVRGLYPIEEYPRMRTALRSFGPFASITDALFKRKFLMLNVDWDSTPIIFDLKEDLTWGGQPRAAYPTKPFAAECELYPVIRTIKGSIESFRLEEDILSSERVHVSMVDPGRSLSLWHLSTHALRNGTWSPCTSSRTRSPATPIEFINGTLHSYYFKNRNADGRWSLASTRGELYFDTEEELMAWGNRSFYPKDCVWEVEGMIPLTLTQHFGKVFDYASVHTTNYSNMSTYFGDPWMRRLYANGTANLTTVEAYAANLAESMSNYIRAWGDSGTPVLVEGQSYRTETCIKVEWKLGAFPASLVPLAFIFLALTIWRTKRQEVRQPPWRSSSLPVLIHGLAHAGKRNDMKGLERNSEMEDVSGDIKVRLAKGERGWGLQ